MPEGSLGFLPMGSPQASWQPLLEFPMPAGEESPALTELHDKATSLGQTS